MTLTNELVHSLAKGRFTGLRALAYGSFGPKFTAFDRERRELVVLKPLDTYDSDASWRDHRRSMVEQEFRVLSGLRHPNLVQVYGAFYDDENLFVAMEFVRGVEFSRYIWSSESASATQLPSSSMLTSEMAPETTSKLGQSAPEAEWGSRGPYELTPSSAPQPDSDPGVSVRVSRIRRTLPQLVEGLVAVHAAGKIHRDIKPSNVLVEGDARVVLVDFDLAVDAESSREEVAGTPIYMAPEMTEPNVPTPASDLYAVGVMLFEALAGRHPFALSTPDRSSTISLSGLFVAKRTQEAPKLSTLVPEVPTDLDSLCAGLLKRDPNERPYGRDVARFLRRHEPRGLGVRVFLAAYGRLTVGVDTQLFVQLSDASLSWEIARETPAIDIVTICPGASVNPLRFRVNLPTDPASVPAFRLLPLRAGMLELTIVLLVRNEPIHTITLPLSVSPPEVDQAVTEPGPGGAPV